ncbi:MAG: hypothetical protein ACTHKU_13770, partial [Verrucomicrobiota bacterium]
MKSAIRVFSFFGLLSVLPSLAQPEPPHPMLSISSKSGSAANTVTNSWTEEQYTNNFTPRWAPRNESYSFGPAVVPNDTGWSWSASNPNQITSKPSGTIFPSTTNYLVRTQAVNVFGTTVYAPYYNKAGSTTSKSFVFNVIEYHKREKLRGDLENLMGAYVNTSISAANRYNYARRIAVALLDWARYFPSYTMTDKNNCVFINTDANYVLSGDDQRSSDHNGLAHEWKDTDILAFDAIYDSAALADLSTELGFDVRGYIATNLFCYEGDFFVNRVPIDVAITSNLSEPYAILPQVARVLNRPDYMIWMDAYLDATVRKKIRRDGALEEGSAYSYGYVNQNQEAAQNAINFFIDRAATNDTMLAISNRTRIANNVMLYGKKQWEAIALPNG